MPVTERQRRELYDALVRVLSEEAADTLMELLVSSGRPDAGCTGDLAELRWRMADRFHLVERAIAELRSELRLDLINLRTDLRSEITRVRSDLLARR